MFWRHRQKVTLVEGGASYEARKEMLFDYDNFKW